MRKALLLPILFIAFNAVSQDRIQQAKDILTPLLQTYPGISVTVGVNNEIVWAQGFGFANVEEKKPADENTKFRLYSLSKSITGMALVKLISEGKLNTEKPITEYLPNLPAPYKTVKVAHLISHSAGVRHYKGGEWMKVSRSGCSTAKEAIAVFINDPLEFEPGTKYSYSSFGYVLLSAMIEEITKMSYPDFIRTEILLPAGINEIAFDKTPEAAMNESVSYEKWDLVKVKAKKADDVNNTCKFGGGGFVGTSTALVNLHLAMLNGKIVQGDAFEKYYATFMANSGESLKYGFGIGVLETGEGVKYHTHTGSAVGANGAMFIYPKEKIVVVVLGNLDDPAMNSVIGKVAKLFK